MCTDLARCLAACACTKCVGVARLCSMAHSAHSKHASSAYRGSVLPMQACAQVPCAECGRTFRADRIAKHTQVCRTTTKKLAKRKVFDVGKQRVEVGHRTTLAPVAARARCAAASFTHQPWLLRGRGLRSYSTQPSRHLGESPTLSQQVIRPSSRRT